MSLLLVIYSSVIITTGRVIIITSNQSETDKTDIVLLHVRQVKT